MPGASNTAENHILDAMLGDGHTADFPDPVYVALFTTAPSESALGTEPVGNGYARVAVDNDTVQWPDAAGGIKANANAVQFPAATGAGWGTVTHWAIVSAAAAGYAIAFGSLSVSRTVTAGIEPFFDVGALQVTCD